MPLWRIFHPKDLYSPEEKAALSTAITKIYSTLPAFYVVVLFIPIESSDSCFVGGQPHDDFVRVVVEQIARRFDPNDVKKKSWWMSRVEETIAPWVKGKVKDWEVHIAETDRDLWRINGLVPPQPNSAAENLWVRENRPVPYEKL